MRKKPMQRNDNTQSGTPGTLVGGTISLLLLLAFSTTSFLASTKDANANAPEQAHRNAIVRAYLA
jgi:hypothetical protein